MDNYIVSARKYRPSTFRSVVGQKSLTVTLKNAIRNNKPASLYETFLPEEAKRIWDRFEFIYTPKHGSWLNMAEIELHVLTRQCLSRRIGDMNTMKEEVMAWQKDRNNRKTKIKWQFTNANARIKLKKLYPFKVGLT